jgi:hypothetical protein
MNDSETILDAKLARLVSLLEHSDEKGPCLLAQSILCKIISLILLLQRNSLYTNMPLNLLCPLNLCNLSLQFPFDCSRSLSLFPIVRSQNELSSSRRIATLCSKNIPIPPLILSDCLQIKELIDEEEGVLMVVYLE